MSRNHRPRPTARLAGACLWLALAGLFAGGTPLRASPAPRAHVARPVATASSEGWSMGRVWAHFRTRSGVIQLCIGAMAFALFILMRKLDDGPPRA
jgi:hypothetical protein